MTDEAGVTRPGWRGLVDRSLASPRWLLELFAWGNLAFLGVDIVLAHAVNDFAHPGEWIPLGVSILAAVALLPGLFGGHGQHGPSRPIGVVVGVLSIVCGVAGLLYHLGGSFFEARTLRTLVYSAPFVAPLSYTGVGLLLLLNRLRVEHEREWAEWVVILALGGFVGNLGLALADHAQNGFFHPSEWISVGAAALAVSTLVAVFDPRRSENGLRLAQGCMALQILVGVLGAILHVRGSLGAEVVHATLAERVVFGPPLFAPLLYADIAILALLGLARLRAVESATAHSRSGPLDDAGAAAPKRSVST